MLSSIPMPSQQTKRRQCSRASPTVTSSAAKGTKNSAESTYANTARLPRTTTATKKRKTGPAASPSSPKEQRRRSHWPLMILPAGTLQLSQGPARRRRQRRGAKRRPSRATTRRGGCRSGSELLLAPCTLQWRRAARSQRCMTLMATLSAHTLRDRTGTPIITATAVTRTPRPSTSSTSPPLEEEEGEEPPLPQSRFPLLPPRTATAAPPH